MKHFLLAAAATILSHPACAQAVAPQDAEPANDGVIVTATRANDGIERDLSGDSVSQIDRDAMDHRAVRQVADVLRDVPGVAVGATPGQTQLRLRGGEANHVLVLVDGIEVSDPFAGEFDVATLPADMAARIEVLRGPQSALYGSDAIGGVVHYVTLTGREAPGMSGRIEGGSFGTVNAAARAAGVTGSFDYALSATLASTDGTPGARDGSRDLSADSRAVSLKAGWAVAADARLIAVLRHARGSGEFNLSDADPASPTFGYIVDTPGLRYRSKGAYGLLRGELDMAGGRWTHALSAQFADSRRDTFRDAVRDSGSEGTRYKGSYETTLRLGDGAVRHRLTLALDAERESARNTDPTGFAFTGRRDFDNLGLVGEYRAEFGDHAGLGAAVRHDVNDRFADATTYRIDGTVRLARATRLRAALGSGVKNPGFYELYGFIDGRYIGNPGLRPERSTGWEVGLEQSLANDRVSIGGGYFASRLDAEVYTLFLPPTFVATSANRDSVSRRRGFEGVAHALLAGGWRIDAMYSYLDAREDGAREVRRPRHSASMAIDWQSPGGEGGATLVARYTGRQRDLAFIDPSFVPVAVALDDYLLVGLNGRWALNQSIEAFARVENLLDETYEDVFSYATPGRSMLAGIRARF